MHKFIGMHSDTIFLFEEETYPLKDSKVFKKYIGTDSIRRDFGIWYQNKLKEEQWQKEKEEEEKREEARRKIEEEKRIKEEERYFRMLEKRQKQYLVELKTFSLEQVKKKMTRNERNLFEKLIKKHAYNDENFPGIFNVFTNYNYLIKTPSPLWQLLIYDYYIYRKFEPYDKVWIPKIKDMFYKLRQQGVLRFKYRDNDDHFTFAIYDYFNKLNNIGIVIKLGFNNVKYQKILANQLPLHSGKNTHKCVAYYLSFADDVTGLTEELSEIETNFTLYKKMISQNPKLNNENLTSNMEALRSQLEYTNNLLETQSGLGNEWELTFISDMYSLVRRRYLLSQKQREKIESIIKRIEKTLDISLSKNK